MRNWAFLSALMCVLALSACAESQALKIGHRLSSHPYRSSAESDDTPVAKPRYVLGQAYFKRGKLYVPRQDFSYDEVGVASWYGSFHAGLPTANGEIFDPSQLTAAHTTLPLPSVIQVTNLENGKSLILRVNDRGPYIDGRILDVSERAAELLGFKREGLAKVHIKILPEASRKAADELMK